MAATSRDNDVPRITLHWLEVSRSHRILWLLEELGIPYELKTWKRGLDMRADPRLRDIHPLGKSPIVTIERGSNKDPLVLIESAAIAEYLCDYYGKDLVPARYLPDSEPCIAAETEEWLRYRTYMHYAEGSLMPLNLVALLMATIKKSPVPFFIRPITNSVADKITAAFLRPNFETHYKFLESQLETAPNGGGYLCGNQLTAADILMSFPLEAGSSRSGFSNAQYPKLFAYVERLHQRDAYKRAVDKIKVQEGSFKSML